MVGTNTVCVIRSRSMAASTAAGSKRGSSTCAAPTHVQATTLAVPATWNIGQTWSQRCGWRWPVAIRLWRALASRLPWLSITPLGRPVVPPVYEIAASAPDSTPGTAAGAPAARPS